MKILVTRYYGDERSAKSRMLVVDDATGGVCLECEAREATYVDYDSGFRGCSKVCLPVGEFRCKVKSSDLSPMTVVVSDAPGHKGCRIGWHDVAQQKCNEVLIGVSDEYPKAKWRRMVKQEDTFHEFEKLVYAAFLKGEEILLVVRNEIEGM